jgi:hypothetical protein
MVAGPTIVPMPSVKTVALRPAAGRSGKIL